MTESDQPVEDQAREPLEERVDSSAEPEAGSQVESGASEEAATESAPATESHESKAAVPKAVESEPADDEMPPKQWYILKVAVNREKSICDALRRRIKLEGLEDYFDEILVPTEDVREYNKSGKPRIVKKRLYPGYVVVNMSITDETWFIVRDTAGVGDFTGAAGKPTPLTDDEVSKILQVARASQVEEKESPEIKTAIRFRVGDKVRVKEGYFQNFEGDVSTIDESNGRITVMINIFGRPTPVELDHWQVEDV